MSERTEQFKAERSLAELDRQWVEYLRLIHVELARIAKELENIRQNGIIAYPKA